MNIVECEKSEIWYGVKYNRLWLFYIAPQLWSTDLAFDSVIDSEYIDDVRLSIPIRLPYCVCAKVTKSQSCPCCTQLGIIITGFPFECFDPNF